MRENSTIFVSIVLFLLLSDSFLTSKVIRVKHSVMTNKVTDIQS